jgi:hypothetical protein
MRLGLVEVWVLLWARGAGKFVGVDVQDIDRTTYWLNTQDSLPMAILLLGKRGGDP